MDQAFAVALGGLILIAAANSQQWGPPVPEINLMFANAHPAGDPARGDTRSSPLFAVDGMDDPARTPLELAAEALWGAP